MCGITGFLDVRCSQEEGTLYRAADSMVETLIHRGPDDKAIWINAKEGVALAFRRLAIIDVSSHGRQPMHSHCGRYTIIFNGEIYNFRDLRTQLELEKYPFAFCGHSDTEVLLAAVTQWGLESTLARINGMFAFALWDNKEKKLFLARDRIGKKPLYYGWCRNHFLFGSELKALRAHPSFQSKLNMGALALFFRHNYVPSPHSIYEGIHKIPPGCWATIDPRRPGHIVSPISYWSAKRVAEEGSLKLYEGTENEALLELGGLISDSVRLRMIADVPLGAFLSGGIDSSLVVAMMQSHSSRPVQTFSIGFEEGAYDEARFARAVAHHLGTSHTELIVNPKKALELIPNLPKIFDEPFSDSSQIPTLLVSQLARRTVTVSLSGDGGDELFGGYNRYVWGRHLWSSVGWTPRRLRHLASKGLRYLSPQVWDNLISHNPFLPSAFNFRNPADKIRKLANVFGAESEHSLYRELVSHWEPQSILKPNISESSTVLSEEAHWPDLNDFMQRMMYFDTVMYLPDDILTKVDRASMGVSLEARAPLLDFRLIELAWQLPQSLKVRSSTGKWCLRQILSRYVPKKLFERPKMGFALPMASWLRGPLREWGESLIDESHLKNEGLLNVSTVRKKWEEHQTGTHNWQDDLWDVFVFQSWLRENSPSIG